MKQRLAWCIGVVIIGVQGMTAAQGVSKMGTPWERLQEGGDWQGQVHDEAGGARLRWVFPGRTEGGPPNRLAYESEMSVPDGETVMLTFVWTDTFTGPTAGYHVLVAAVDGEVVWESDVAGGSNQPERVSVDVTALCRGRDRVRLVLGAETRRRVTNFGVVIQAKNPQLARAGFASGTAQDYQALPPDLPLPALPANGTEWTSRAVVLQPWGRTQYDALCECGDLPERLARDYGFNAMIVLPPGAHAYTAPAEKGLSEAQFTDALAAYRAAGFRVLLYSSIMHLGHSHAWESGRIAREHPEWAQRDAEGGTVDRYGHPWLCPSTGALDYAIEYTLGIVRRYAADGVMLDNNQFMNTPRGGPTCYCEACRRGFRTYVGTRFGAGVQVRFGVPAAEIDIPVFPGELMNVWIHWRNRVWAQANERFRQALRAENPNLIFFANTQYGHSGWTLATDDQYMHEDVMLSESRSLDSLGMSAKLTLGLALAQGRPVWNYIGTFREDDFQRLRPPRTVAAITAPALALQVSPWIVYYGFSAANDEDEPARKALRDLLGFRRNHPELCLDLRPWAPLGVLFDLRSRSYLGTPLQPACLQPLLRAGVALRGLRAKGLSATDLDGVRLLVASNAACLSDAECTVLNEWLAAGGKVLASVDFATRDELGIGRPTRGVAVAEGTNLRLVESPDDLAALVLAHTAARFKVYTEAGEAAVECRAYFDEGRRLVLHLVNHGETLAEPVRLRLPAEFAHTYAKGQFRVPGQSNALSVPVTGPTEQREIVLPGLDVYGVVVLSQNGAD